MMDQSRTTFVDFPRAENARRRSASLHNMPHNQTWSQQQPQSSTRRNRNNFLSFIAFLSACTAANNISYLTPGPIINDGASYCVIHLAELPLLTFLFWLPSFFLTKAIRSCWTWPLPIWTTCTWFQPAPYCWLDQRKCYLWRRMLLCENSFGLPAPSHLSHTRF